MTSIPDEQPLSRRERRERDRLARERAEGQGRPAAAEDAPAMPESQRDAAASSTPSAVAGERADRAPEQPAPAAAGAAPTSPDAPTDAAPASTTPGDQPLTRRQLRERERARTAAVDIVPPAQGAPTAVRPGQEQPRTDRPSEAVAPRPAADAATPVVADAPAESAQPQVSKAEQRRLEKAKREQARREKAKAKKTGQEEAVREGGPTPRGIEETLTAAVQEIEEPVEVREPLRPVHEDGAQPTVASAFGKNVGLTPKALRVEPEAGFDEVVAPEARTAEALTTSSVLILPASPGLPAGGAPIVTGSVDIHSSTRTSAPAPGADRTDMDAGVDSEGNVPATAGTPISATQAVSTHAATRDVITPPTKSANSKLLMILAITAGVLCVAVLGVVITGLITGAF